MCPTLEAAQLVCDIVNSEVFLPDTEGLFMKKLKVPIALDEAGSPIRVENAEKGKHYFCPSCSVKLTLRVGDVKVPHFAHQPSEVCSEETITHKTAKFLVQKAVRDAHAGMAPYPIVERECSVCSGTVAETLSRKLEDAELETKLSCGYIVDVVLLSGGAPRAAVEIRVKHPVDEEKKSRLSVPFVELDGYEIVKNPLQWKTIQSKSPKPVTCTECRSHADTFKVKALQVAMNSKVPLPEAYYRYGLCGCYRCGREILVFTYPGHQSDPTSMPTHRPIPATLRFQFSKTVGSEYWMNTCPYCRASQGDFFLYHEPDGPFFAFDCGEETSEAFRVDIMQLAHYAAVLRGLR